MTLLFALLLQAVSSLLALSQADPDWRAERVAACEAIPKTQTSDGLFFNPPGLKTYYDRSECLQKAAVDLRAPDLCSRVRERRLPFQDGSGISQTACYDGIERAIAEDTAQATEILNAPRQQLTRLELQPYANAEKLKLLIDYGDGPSGRHQLSLTAAQPGTDARLLDTYIQPTSSGNGQLTHFIDRDLFRTALGEDFAEHGFTLTARWCVRTDPRDWIVHQAVEPHRPCSSVSVAVPAGAVAPLPRSLRDPKDRPDAPH
ncbi:MAG: hypothetical protein AAGJ84_10155 [Pseudomonadota bacterium]